MNTWPHIGFSFFLHKLVIGLITMMSYQTVSSQTIAFNYDAIGNRILRDKATNAVMQSRSYEPVSTITKLPDITVSVYPNPVSDIMNVTISNYDILSDAELLIYNSYGVLLNKSRIYDSATQLNIAHMPTGLYFIKVRISDKVDTFNIIKY